MGWKVVEIQPNDFNVDVSPASLGKDVVNQLANVDFYAGVARSLSDLSAFTVPAQNPVAIQGYTDDTNTYIGYCGTLGVYAYGSLGTHFSIMPASGLTGADYWDTTSFGKWLVVTSDTVGEKPHAISAALTLSGGKLAPLPGWWPISPLPPGALPQPTNVECTVIKKHRNVLWAANTIEDGIVYPNRVRWSASSPTDALPSTWCPAPANDAGFTDLEFVGGNILDMCAVGDVMFIGAPGGLWAARWVGGQYVYSFSQINGNIGPRSLRCMESIGEAVAVLTLNDLLIVDENSQTSIAIGRINTLVRQFQTAELLYVASSRQLYVMYSLVNEIGYQHALIWDQDSNTWGARDFAATPFSAVAPVVLPVKQPQVLWDADNVIWNSASNAWEKPTTVQISYIGGNASGLYVAQGLSYNWYMSKTLIAAPNNENIRVRSLEVDADGIAGQQITMRMGSSNYAGQDPVWGQRRTYTLGDQKPTRHDDIQQGRFFSFQLSGNGPLKINTVRLFLNQRENKP